MATVDVSGTTVAYLLSTTTSIAACWIAACWHYVAYGYATAMYASSKLQRLLWASSSPVEKAEYHVFSVLSQAACYEPIPTAPRREHEDALVAHQRRLRAWVENRPKNLANFAEVIDAEITPLECRDGDAMSLYGQASRAGRNGGFIRNEAIAHKRASVLYWSRAFNQIAGLYLHNARYTYLRWNADGKARQREKMYPRRRTAEATLEPTSMIGAPIEHLDLATVIKMSQAVSGEIVLEEMLDMLLRTAIAQAGAERGLLILSHTGEPRIAAEATTSREMILAEFRDAPLSDAVLPETVIRRVLRDHESVILDDAMAQPLFATDPYIRRHRARSILALPLIAQTAIIGVLYLENNSATRVFVPTRIAVLKLVATLAALALENTRLYADLEQREAKIRRLLDANIVGTFIWEIEGRILEANDAFLRMLGYDQGDLLSGPLRWTDLTPPEWLERDARAIEELRTTATAQSYEKEYFRKDGSRVSVLIDVATLEEDVKVAFVLDLTEVRQSDQRYREIEIELEHASRVATMGQLTSIAHEVNQPIAAAVINAQTALRWLACRPPDLDEVRQALGRIIEHGNRAADVISRIRTLIKKAPPRRDRVEINPTICEMFELVHGEAVKNGVLVQAELAAGLPPIHGDRVQLQQVILNLIINAIEAMSRVGESARELLVTTSQDEAGSVLVAVRDSGPGLASATLERLFEPFYTTKPSGLGLGLSICRSIIEGHGGRLWASANAPRGTVFQFTLPAHPDIAS
jgi:PAS domain S-box-containing protein